MLYLLYILLIKYIYQICILIAFLKYELTQFLNVYNVKLSKVDQLFFNHVINF